MTTGFTCEPLQGEMTELMKKRMAEKAMIRNALKSQMNRREKHVAQMKDEDRHIDQVLLHHNDMFMEKHRL